MEPFRLRQDDADETLLMLQSWCAEEGITAGFTTRHANNTALHVGDDPAAVIRNRKRVAERLGWSFDAWTCAEQVHGNEVRIIARDNAGSGRYDRESAIPHTDALVTNEADILLAMFYADCVPLYFYDPVTQSLGLAHAGWKGTVADIAARTVGKMSAEFGADPANIRAAIGPSIGGCCYEVDEAVLRHVRPILNTSADTGVDGLAERFVVPSRDGRARLDLKLLNRHLMIKAGILPSSIEMTSWCTGCSTDLLYSHRMEQGNAGRMMSLLGRKTR
ncbi:peptidoglycan editing factor PgeF [Cohnella panacarvi]|uniref:peptidoglycan editing factor PgeF n=1 Tax=Cohnella panacarvi TaxID=400776 RepID=UPI00047E4011|nr:peptidoglycan editing factor PgeF [Cohnella panacarvi]